jgi:hypothetical protein
MQVYAAISNLEETLPSAQSEGRTRGVVLHANSPRTAQSVALGGYVFEASLSRAWSTGSLLEYDGGMLLLESRPDEFLVVGSGLTVKMSRDGDQSNQGRQLTMDPIEIRAYRVRLYSAQP